MKELDQAAPPSVEEAVPVFAASDPYTLKMDDSPNVYTLAPMTFRQRVAFRAEMARIAGVRPSQEDYNNALVAAVTELAPSNMDEALAILAEAAELTKQLEGLAVESEDRPGLLARSKIVQAHVNQLMVACMDVPVFADLRASHQRWEGMAPYVAAKYSLIGWEGPGLPPFARVRGAVPDDVLDVLPPSELTRVGWRAFVLASVDKAAAGNSGQPSP